MLTQLALECIAIFVVVVGSTSTAVSKFVYLHALGAITKKVGTILAANFLHHPTARPHLQILLK